MTRLSEAYNFAYSDRFAPVQVTLNPGVVDNLEIVLEDGKVGKEKPIHLRLLDFLRRLFGTS